MRASVRACVCVRVRSCVRGWVCVWACVRACVRVCVYFSADMKTCPVHDVRANFECNDGVLLLLLYQSLCGWPCRQLP